MYRILILTTLFFLSCSGEDKLISQEKSKIQDGDIIFQSSLSDQAGAIKLATHSQYSHCGIIFEDNGEWMVYEAVQPVKKTPLQEWIDRGEESHYVIKRLKNAKKVLTSAVLDEMQEMGESYLGIDYDIYFNWSDEELYCSELVWKMYDDAAGIQIGELNQLKDFDLTSDIVKQVLENRYGSTIPYEEPVVAPADLFESDKLILIEEK